MTPISINKKKFFFFTTVLVFTVFLSGCKEVPEETFSWYKDEVATFQYSDQFKAFTFYSQVSPEIVESEEYKEREIWSYGIYQEGNDPEIKLKSGKYAGGVIGKKIGTIEYDGNEEIVFSWRRENEIINTVIKNKKTYFNQIGPDNLNLYALYNKSLGSNIYFLHKKGDKYLGRFIDVYNREGRKIKNIPFAIFLDKNGSQSHLQLDCKVRNNKQFNACSKRVDKFLSSFSFVYEDKIEKPFWVDYSLEQRANRDKKFESTINLNEARLKLSKEFNLHERKGALKSFNSEELRNDFYCSNAQYFREEENERFLFFYFSSVFDPKSPTKVPEGLVIKDKLNGAYYRYPNVWDAVYDKESNAIFLSVLNSISLNNFRESLSSKAAKWGLTEDEIYQYNWGKKESILAFTNIDRLDLNDFSIKRYHVFGGEELSIKNEALLATQYVSDEKTNDCWSKGGDSDDCQNLKIKVFELELDNLNVKNEYFVNKIGSIHSFYEDYQELRLNRFWDEMNAHFMDDPKESDIEKERLNNRRVYLNETYTKDFPLQEMNASDVQAYAECNWADYSRVSEDDYFKYLFFADNDEGEIVPGSVLIKNKKNEDVYYYMDRLWDMAYDVLTNSFFVGRRIMNTIVYDNADTENLAIRVGVDYEELSRHGWESNNRCGGCPIFTMLEKINLNDLSWENTKLFGGEEISAKNGKVNFTQYAESSRGIYPCWVGNTPHEEDCSNLSIDAVEINPSSLTILNEYEVKSIGSVGSGWKDTQYPGNDVLWEAVKKYFNL